MGIGGFSGLSTERFGKRFKGNSQIEKGHMIYVKDNLILIFQL
jgi:hypothetical protein